MGEDPEPKYVCKNKWDDHWPFYSRTCEDTYMSGLDGEVGETLHRDRTAALEGGFLQENIEIEVEWHEMVQHCNTWPKCDKELQPMLAPRLLKEVQSTASF